MLRKDIEEKFPFLSVVTYGGQEYVGIINNQDSFITSMYVFTQINSEEEKARFIELGEVWWWESNRMLPIDVFLYQEMQDFRHCLRTFINKETEILFGPVTSMQNILRKRIKRRSIQLVKKIPPEE